MIEIAQLIEAGIAPTQAREFAAPLTKACALFDINTPTRIAAFLGQAALESARFTAMEESLYYRSAERIRARFSNVHSLEEAARLTRNPVALANVAYGGRIGNGPPESGDGWTYRGRGIFQLTGRGNYTAAGVALNRPYVAEPQLLARPLDACVTAAWFWSEHKLNRLADAWDIDSITRAVNGKAMLHKAERQQLSDEARMAFA